MMSSGNPDNYFIAMQSRSFSYIADSPQRVPPSSRVAANDNKDEEHLCQQKINDVENSKMLI